MGSAENQVEPLRRQLERVLASPGFARSQRLSRLLRFVVERHLEGRDTDLKETLIAVEVFGRQPDYDPKLDSIVRSEAARLRSRLIEYYAGEGSRDPVVIELPKGGYTPRFREAEAAPAMDGARKTRSRRVWLVAALAGLVVALAAMGWRWVQRKSGPIAIAVLPLENLSHDPANDYFADGLTDELIRNLSIIDGLAPCSRTSSFAFKGQRRSMREMGKQLASEYILEGSVLRVGQQLRINVQLVRVHDDFPLWTGKYEREVTDVFAIQDEISRGVVNSLRLKLGRGRRRYETSPEAYDLYLRARALGVQGGEPGYEQSIGPFEEAIAKDPSFAPAYAGLAAAHAARSGRGSFDHSDERLKMRAAAEKAIQLDPLLAEAHDALGMAYARDAQWEQSEKAFRRAIELDPSNSQARLHFANHLLWPLGRIGEALKQLHLAEKTDPLAPPIHNVLAAVLMSTGRYDEAAGHCEKLPANHVFTSNCLGQVRFWQGRTDEAIRILASAGSEFLGYAYARTGRREEAEKLAAASLNPFVQAQTFAGLADKDRALEALDRAATMGPVRMGRLLTNQEYALLRGDPRLKALRKRLGLPE